MSDNAYSVLAYLSLLLTLLVMALVAWQVHLSLPPQSRQGHGTRS